MKLFKIERNADLVGYDEYDAFVVRAEDKEDALLLCNEYVTNNRNYEFEKESVIIEEITQDGERVAILGSFNAG